MSLVGLILQLKGDVLFLLSYCLATDALCRCAYACPRCISEFTNVFNLDHLDNKYAIPIKGEVAQTTIC